MEDRAEKEADAAALELEIAHVCGVMNATTGRLVLAVFWAAAQHVDVSALDIPAMARAHGVLNALGFSLAGLLGWVGA